MGGDIECLALRYFLSLLVLMHGPPGWPHMTWKACWLSVFFSTVSNLSLRNFKLTEARKVVMLDASGTTFEESFVVIRVWYIKFVNDFAPRDIHYIYVS